MSTTVTYKGSTLTTATNQTRTLKTSGKYLEGDITVVDVTAPSPTMQAKTNINPTTSSQTITPDDGYDGLSSVQINAMPSGSATPAASISATGASVTAGTNTLTLSKTVSNTPQVSAGYVSSGTAGNSAVSLTASVNTRSSIDLAASGATVTAPAGYYESAASKSVASGTEGTPTATKGTVSNHSVSVTPSVTNSAGYISGGTHTGTAVSVSASELVSGTLNVTSSGTKDVTNYASASILAMTLPTAASGSSSGTSKATIGRSTSNQYINIPTGFNDTASYYTVSAVANGTEGTPTATKGTVSNHQVSVTPSVTNTAGYISGGTHNGTAVTVTASELASGNKAITENGTNIDVVGYSTVSVSVQGGGGTPWTVGQGDIVSHANDGLTFADVDGEPTAWILFPTETTSNPTSGHYVAIIHDSVETRAWVYQNGNAAEIDASSTVTTYYNATYNNFIINVTGAFADNGYYGLYYIYGGSGNLTFRTDTYAPGSGVTSAQYSLSENPPVYFVGLSTSVASASYHRVQTVTKVHIPNVAQFLGGSNFYTSTLAYLESGDGQITESYSNGTLTVSTNNYNDGGYFHNPGTYTIFYLTEEDLSGSNYQKKTVTPTTSQQIVTADTGYDALSQVTVNAIPNTYVQPSTTVGATTYRASTSNQTIQSGTYHSAAATIAAVSQTNLEAGNIKSGTTISISNGQSNLWSVTGTYTGGGGTSKNVQINQSTTRTSSSTLSKANGDLTVSKTGTYDVYWTATRSATSSQYTWGSQLYVGGSAYGSVNTSWNNHVQNNHLSNVSLTENQKIAVYTQGRSGSYYVYAPMLVIIEA